MRIFWLIILVLAMLAAALLWRDRAKAPPAQQAESGKQGDRSAGLRQAPPAEAITPPAPAARDAAKPAAAESPASVDALELIDDLLESSRTGQESSLLAAALEHAPRSNAGQIDADATAGQVDGHYIISGDGSADAPFEITWDLLMLASQTYRPREGQTDIPVALQSIHGKRIRIDGYFAFPLASVDAREVLFMLNMWDGCCIGLPPSPYDAIEVRLKEPMGGTKQFLNYGTLTGTLQVDPFVQNGWLLGMYLMEDGELDVSM